MIMIKDNKIYCMDCLEGLKCLADNSVDLVFTSPPYNMRTRVRNGKYTTREKGEHFSKKYAYFDDALSIEDYYQFHKNVLEELLRVSPIVFWNIQIVTGSKEAIFRLIGDFHKEIKDVVVWDKGWGQPAMHENVISRGSELILIFEQNASAGRAFKNSQFKRGTMQDIWRIKRKKTVRGHGACFPVALVKEALNGWTVKGSLVLDPFMGTGSTAVACQQTGRNFIGFEISKEYVAIAEKRLAQRSLNNTVEREE